MREKLNENPLAQAVFIGVLVLAVGFILFTRVLNRGDAEAPAAPAATEATAVTPGAAPSASAPGVAADSSAVPGGPTVGVADKFEAGPGLPKAVVEAYDQNKAIALLIIREHPQGCFSSPQTRCGGIDDRRVEPMVRALGASPKVEVFVTHAINIARYSRITQGVDVDRVPALIIVEPKREAKATLPAATVNYGFRGPTSIVQALRDALYKGRDDLPYYPE